jgi:hypothetical protein
MEEATLSNEVEGDLPLAADHYLRNSVSVWKQTVEFSQHLFTRSI